MDESKRFADRIAGYEKAATIIWLILGILQILVGLIGLADREPELVFFLLIGIWNVIVSVLRFKRLDKIRSLDSRIPKEYEGIIGLIIFGIINVVLGAIIGIAGVILDFYIRSEILSHRDFFTSVGSESQKEIPKALAKKQDVYETLAKLGELKTQGILSEEEFASEKRKLLG